MWDKKRFFLQENAVFNDSTVKICGEEYTHMVNVLRMKSGDKVILLSGVGEEILAEIISISKGEAILQVIERRACENEPRNNLTLFQAVLKNDKMDFVVQKCVELGVSMIQPYTSEFCVAAISDNKLARLKKIADEAVKQCKRAKKVHVFPPISFDEMLASIIKYEQRIFANEREDKTCLKGIINKEQSTCLIVGSEGGFSLQEVENLQNVANSISLGKRILRAETAAIAATALLQYELGELE